MSDKFIKFLGITVGIVAAGVVGTVIYSSIKSEHSCCDRDKCDCVDDHDCTHHNCTTHCYDKYQTEKEIFKARKEAFKLLIDDKHNQIKEVMCKLKQDVVLEQDSDKRERLITETTEKINDLKQQIKNIVDEQRRAFQTIMRRKYRKHHRCKNKSFGSIVCDTVSPFIEALKDKCASICDPTVDCDTIVDCCLYEE